MEANAKKTTSGRSTKICPMKSNLKKDDDDNPDYLGEATMMVTLMLMFMLMLMMMMMITTTTMTMTMTGYLVEATTGVDVVPLQRLQVP